jgi:hypothetical protein
MKALSLRQPWASMIASGAKTIETRVWSTRYRGPILICAASADPDRNPSLPHGVAVCIADVVEVRPMTKDDEPAAGCEVYEKAKAWVLTNIRPAKPRPVRGKPSLFEVSGDVADWLAEEAKA